MEFKNKTEGLDEAKILSMISDPTKPLSSTNPLSDDEEDEFVELALSLGCDGSLKLVERFKPPPPFPESEAMIPNCCC